MTKQNLKQSTHSLSACSIPVMLAVIGWSASTHASDSHSTQSLHDRAFAGYSAETATPVQQGNAAQGEAGWILMAPDNQHFWVSKGRGTAISTYRLMDSSGNYELLEEVNDLKSMHSVSGFSATDDTENGWVDLNLSDDGQHLYQIFGESGAVGVYEIDGGGLTLVEVLSA